MNDENVASLPNTLSLEEAFRAAFFMIEIYGDVEKWKSDEIVLLHQYMQTDPARWNDWKHAVRLALDHPTSAVEYLYDWRQQWGKPET
jgi:hypothetical protein